jgi:hypothetical protein
MKSESCQCNRYLHEAADAADASTAWSPYSRRSLRAVGSGRGANAF